MNGYYYSSGRTYSNGTSSGITPAVKGLLIANIIVFLLQQLNPNTIVTLFGLTPATIWSNRAIWQPVTYMFLHGGLMHLLFNMLVLWMFGSTLERVWGSSYFLRYYFITGIGAGLSNAILTPNSHAIIIGASGAIYGLLAAYGILYPNNVIYFYFVIPIKAKYLVALFGLFEFFASLRPNTSAIAHIVHLGGMIIGIIYLKRNWMVRAGARSLKNWLQNREIIRHKTKNETEERLRREIDLLLDKINEVGIENLTSWEKRRLREVSEMLKSLEENSKN